MFIFYLGSKSDTQNWYLFLKKLTNLRFNDLFRSQMASLMWDFDHGNLPEDLNSLFTTRSDIHTINLRNAGNDRLYTATRRSTKYGFLSFSHQGSLLLNELKELDIYNNSTSKKTFSKKYKDNIFGGY